MVIIYLFRKLLSGINLPTLPDSFDAFCRAGKKSGFTWHFSAQGLPKILITKYSRELLPHVFTITSPRPSPEGGRIRQLFSVALSISLLTNPAIHRCAALRCPDFPPRRGRGDNPACNFAKINRFMICFGNLLFIGLMNPYIYRDGVGFATVCPALQDWLVVTVIGHTA